MTNRPVVMVCLESPHAFWHLSLAHEDVLRTRFPDVDFRIATSATVLDHLPDAHVYFGWRFASDWFALAPHLKWIASPAAGTDHLPLVQAQASDVVLTRSYGFHGRPMAEHAIGLILGFSRGLFTCQRLQQARLWWKDDLAEEFFDLAGATMTIVGCGSIGGHLSRAARPFGMSVIGVRRTPNPRPEDGITWMRPIEIHQAVADADVVVDLLPAADDTKGFFSREVFAACKPGALFLNLGRASTVDHTALLTALDAGQLLGAALDVTDPRPLPLDHPLRHHPRVVLTPKSATFSRTYMDEAVSFFADNLHRHLTGQPLNGLATAPAVRTPIGG
ncbi:D-2-hydroxyacid dehydrogenase [Planomonospora sp. ID82291]|uniref:D-2-hydroxyacid dehydrogenase n=1 Tax=Planomonospora sp. ID82291 TaxID=2738136 RepID=UPI0018C405E0|nr:D-2-hydroxyacid dehydrogenase [Planomonospora sp. ID82291]MBG0818680.1 D-2-hydroxyacid dehydrogenase [Planomonospora sp. ID82291]